MEKGVDTICDLRGETDADTSTLDGWGFDTQSLESPWIWWLSTECQISNRISLSTYLRHFKIIKSARRDIKDPEDFAVVCLGAGVRRGANKGIPHGKCLHALSGHSFTNGDLFSSFPLINGMNGLQWKYVNILTAYLLLGIFCFSTASFKTSIQALLAQHQPQSAEKPIIFHRINPCRNSQAIFFQINVFSQGIFSSYYIIVYA